MRADQLLVARQLASSRSQAQRLIANGLQWLKGAEWKTVTKNNFRTRDGNQQFGLLYYAREFLADAVPKHSHVFRTHHHRPVEVYANDDLIDWRILEFDSHDGSAIPRKTVA